MPDIVSPKSMDVTRIVSEGYANIGRAYAGMISNISNVAGKTILNLAEIKVKNYNFYKELLENMKTPEGINIVSQLHIMNSINEGKSALAKIYAKSKGWLSLEDKALMSEVKKNVENEIVKHKTISKLVVDAVDRIKSDEENLYDADFLNKQLETYAQKGDVVVLTETETGNPFLRIKRYDNAMNFLTEVLEEYKAEKMKTQKPTTIEARIVGDIYEEIKEIIYGPKEEAINYVAKKIFEDKKAFYTFADEMKSFGINPNRPEIITAYLDKVYGDKISEALKPYRYVETRQAYKYGGGGGGGNTMKEGWQIGEVSSVYQTDQTGNFVKTLALVNSWLNREINVPVTNQLIEDYGGDMANILRDSNVKITKGTVKLKQIEGDKVVFEISNVMVESPLGTTTENVKFNYENIMNNDNLRMKLFSDYLAKKGFNIDKVNEKKKQKFYNDFINSIEKEGGYETNINNLFTKYGGFIVTDIKNVMPYLKGIPGFDEIYSNYLQKYKSYIKSKEGQQIQQQSQVIPSVVKSNSKETKKMPNKLFGN